MTEITLWLIPCAIIAGVLTAGAWVWETGGRWSGRGARWGWLVALAGSVLLPFALRLVPAAAWRAAVPPVGVVRLDGLAVSAATAAGAAKVSADAVAVLVWVVLSLLVVGYAFVVLVRLRWARRRWRRSEVDGAPVLVSRDTGPAAVGVRRGEVVIPSWALALDAELRRLMLLHEREHVRAGDPRLLLGGLALLAVMPWHPLVWFQFMRLRNAIELDCDARVLRGGADPGRYGSLLLEIGQRRAAGGFVLATFAEPRAFLEQRIRRIAAWPVPRRPLRAAVSGAVALVLFSTALLARVEAVGSAVTESGAVLDQLGVVELPPLVPPVAVDTPPPSSTRPRRLPRDPSAAPTFTPFTQKPELLNPQVAQRALLENYPPLLRDAGIGGTAVIWFYIDEAGRVSNTLLSRSSGYPALDEAALRVAATLLFSPAQNQGRTVPVWVEIPIMFAPTEPAPGAVERALFPATPSRGIEAAPTKPRVPAPAGSAEALAAEVERLRKAARRVSPGTPAREFTPMTERPELRNKEEVGRALIRYYPPLLRDAGIGGTTVLWFHIDEQGNVADVQLAQSSGYAELDEAAIAVASTMEFTPARNRDRVVPVWIQLPIQFAAK